MIFRMRTVTRICQWCHEELKSQEETPAIAKVLLFGQVYQDDCCSKYCASRYKAIRSGMEADKEHCRFCDEILHFRGNWTIKGANFCNGRCIDLWQELPNNPEYKKLRQKEIEKKQEYEKIKDQVQRLETRLMDNKKVSYE